jgi:hypothetical protein
MNYRCAIKFTWHIIVSSLITHFLLHCYNHICVVYLWRACVNACACVYVFACLCIRVYFFVYLRMRLLYTCFCFMNACMFVRGSCDSATRLFPRHGNTARELIIVVAD